MSHDSLNKVHSSPLQGGQTNVQAQAGVVRDTPLQQQQARGEYWRSRVFPEKWNEPFPRPSWTGKYFMEKGKPKKGVKPEKHNYIHIVGLHLNKLALRLLNDHKVRTVVRDAKTHRVPFSSSYRSLDAQELSDALYGYVYDQARSLIVYDQYEDLNNGDRRMRLLDSQLQAKCDNVAEWALSTWDPEYTDRLRRAGAKGGTRSRRGATWTLDDLRPYADQTREEQMAKLGCKLSTIKTLRAQLRAEDELISRLSESPEQGGQTKPSVPIRESDSRMTPPSLEVLAYESLIHDLTLVFDLNEQEADAQQAKVARHEALSQTTWEMELPDLVKRLNL